MISASTLTVVALLVLAVAHSLLGEKRIIGPLVNAEWTIGLPRPAAERIIRFAWHLPTLAWIALALIVKDAPLSLALAIAAGVPGIVLFVTLRTHLAWPLFLVASVAAFGVEGEISNIVFQVAALVTVAIVGLAALLHAYWAVGGRWNADTALPMTRGGDIAFRPGRWLTAFVAVVLAVFGVMVASVAASGEPTVVRGLVGAAAVVLGLRAVGDGKYSGFTKKVRGTKYARADDAFYTPIVVFLALGTVASLLVA